jgi:ribosome-associated protein
MSGHIKRITITKLPIRLGQFIKLVDIVQDGLEAKMKIQNGEIKVNGKLETKRGRKLQASDEITFGCKTWCIEAVL